MHILGILLFIALIVADIVRLFKDDDEFDGIMLFARPVVAFVGTLLCGGTFWTALLCAVGWGVVGFVVSALISEHFSVHSNDISSSSDTNETHNSPVTDAEIADIVIVELVNIIVNKIAYRYPGGIHLFVSDCYTKIEFYDFNDSYSQDFRAVVHQGTCSFGYSWALKYYGDLTETEAVMLRNFGHINHLGNWEIDLRSRNSGQSAIAKINKILKNPPDTVNVEISSGTDATKCSAYLEPAKNQPEANNQPVSTPPRTQPSELSPHLAKQPSGSFEFAFNILPEQDARYNKARASNGVVYYRFSSGASPIGHYELTDSGTRVNIYRTSDKGLIGYVAGDEIYISRKAQYDRECKVRDENGYNYYIKIPAPMELNLAEIRNGAIKDNRSYEYLGFYQGDKYAAAAAFVCLIYECHMEYEYHPFFMNWDK